MLVKDVMRPDAAVVSVSADIRQVLRVLSQSDVRHVLVIDGDSLVGIVSARELRSALLSALGGLKQSSVKERILSQPITRMMSTDVKCVAAEDQLGQAIDLMLEHELGTVPVVENSTRKLIGVVSYVEALRIARERGET